MASTAPALDILNQSIIKIEANRIQYDIQSFEPELTE